MPSELSPRPTAVIAGANGFIGRALIRQLKHTHDIIGITRSDTVRVPVGSGLETAQWRRADLFSSRETEAAVDGATIAFYLVHSMLPSARLTQAKFEDLDLILADNFARACQKMGVQRIVYLGGLIPKEGELSTHLRSRLEVEQTLRAHGVPVTALRAGLVVGREGSSFQMMVKLVRRLPVMLCPKWTQSRTQPIDLRDVVELLNACAHDPDTAGQTYDIGGPDVMTYREMMLATARVIGRNLRAFKVPLFTPGLSRLWVSMITGYSGALVGPLVQSLRHSMVAGKSALQQKLGLTGRPFKESVEHAVFTEGPPECTEVKTVMPLARDLPPRSLVRSVQRLPIPANTTAEYVAKEYLRWLPYFSSLLVVRTDARGWARFYLRFIPKPLLELELIPSRSGDDRQLFIVRGGLLANAKASPWGRLEFRTAVGQTHVLAAIHDFKPRLPWTLYRMTQAVVHLWVMKAFGRHLKRQATLTAPQAPGSAPRNVAS